MGAIIITYQDDKIWVASKALAKLAGQKHDWTVVMTYYSLGGGLHVKLEFIDKEYCSDACKFFHFEAKKKSIIGKVGRIR